MTRKKTPAQKLDDQKENVWSCVDYPNGKQIVEISMISFVLAILCYCICAVGSPWAIREKRKLESIDCNTANSEENEIITLKKRCVEMEERIARLEKSCLCKFSNLDIFLTGSFFC